MNLGLVPTGPNVRLAFLIDDKPMNLSPVILRPKKIWIQDEGDFPSTDDMISLPQQKRLESICSTILDTLLT